MAMGVAMKKGTTPPALTKTPQIVMTKDTVDRYFKPGSAQPLSLPPLSAEDQYLKDVGVLQKFHNVQGLS